jgi:hypothetical protein
MSTLELEVQKTGLAREILTTTDENLINNINHNIFQKERTKNER